MKKILTTAEADANHAGVDVAFAIIDIGMEGIARLKSRQAMLESMATHDVQLVAAEYRPDFGEVTFYPDAARMRQLLQDVHTFQCTISQYRTLGAKPCCPSGPSRLWLRGEPFRDSKLEYHGWISGVRVRARPVPLSFVFAAAATQVE